MKMRESKFLGNWKYLDKALFEISEQRAAKACIELATFMRLLDDREQVSDYLRTQKAPSLGRVVKQGQPDEELYLRDLTNKIVHASNFEWDFSDLEAPKLICVSQKPERWGRAEINVVTLAAICGQLMS